MVCKIVCVRLPVRGVCRVISGEIGTSDLTVDPAGNYCSLNMPEVSLVSPKQFLEHRGLCHRMCTCPSVDVSGCPMGPPKTCEVTHGQWSLLVAPGCSRGAPSPLPSPGMGPSCPFSPSSTLQTPAHPLEPQVHPP